MDKQDELVSVIAEALYGGTVAELIVSGCKTPDVFAHAEQQTLKIAAAVRSFMGSDEVVERVARAIADDLKSRAVYVSDDLRNCLVDGGLFDLHDPARAALSAAIGEDIGGGRG